MDIKVFATSSPFINGGQMLSDKNGFLQNLKEAVGVRRIDVVFVTASPDDIAASEDQAGAVMMALQNSGFKVQELFLIDRRSKRDEIKQLVRKAHLVFLGGGHVPTQNAYFNEINLKSILQHNFEGTILGISAGSMNLAHTVYAMPELKGEAVSKDYKKFLPGLGFIDTNILPHYNANKDEVLDGKKLYKDIAIPDSKGHTFYAIPDGSYIFRDTDGHEQIFGESVLIKDGKMN